MTYSKSTVLIKTEIINYLILPTQNKLNAPPQTRKLCLIF